MSIMHASAKLRSSLIAANVTPLGFLTAITSSRIRHGHFTSSWVWKISENIETLGRSKFPLLPLFLNLATLLMKL